MTVAELIEILKQQDQNLQVGIHTAYTFHKKNGQPPDYYLGSVGEIGHLRGNLVLVAGDVVDNVQDYDDDEIEVIRPHDCYCDEDQGGGYSYESEHGRCDACLSFYKTEA